MIETLEVQVGAVLRANGWTICAAESCTGGLLMHRLTNVSGSSDYVLGGVVSYSNAAKQTLLKVREDTLVAYGAVSKEVAKQMAAGALLLFDADIAVSITGISGPTGGTATKPVGLTYIGLVKRDSQPIVQRYIWHGDREANKAASADAALKLILDLSTNA
jgi:nicotinamide-nucleotide amidase